MSSAFSRRLLGVLAALPLLLQPASAATFGPRDEQTHIELRATDDSWVAVRDGGDQTLFTRLLKSGDSYRVPDRPGLRLDTGNIAALAVSFDGAAAQPLSRTGPGIVGRNIDLDPTALASRVTAAASLPVKASGAAPVATALPVDATSQPMAARAARDTVPVATQGGAIELELGKGTLVRLRQPATTVFIANPETADIQVKSPSLVYVFAKAPGETTLYAVDENERVLYSGTVRVTANLSRLRAGLQTLLPGEPIAVTALEAAIVLSGSVSSAAHAEDARALAQVFAQQSKLGTVVNQLSITSASQINLRVRIVEIGRNTLREFGVNWNSVLKSSSFAFGLITGNPVTMTDNLVRNTAKLTFTSGASSVDAMIDALGQEGLVTVLAEPNLTALSGQTASFLAGGEFPIPIAEQQGQGGPTITIVFKKFGVALDFTPTILDGRRINLHVRPEVSQLTDVGAVQLGTFNVPALSVRRAETTVELGSGESFVIAGLLENDTKLDISKIPGLGDVPILGHLFRSDRFKRNETELAIIVTPYLVRPAPAVALAVATDPVGSGRDGNTRAAATPGLIGAAGFTLD